LFFFLFLNNTRRKYRNMRDVRVMTHSLRAARVKSHTGSWEEMFDDVVQQFGLPQALARPIAGVQSATKL
jgi:hypothetical protein